MLGRDLVEEPADLVRQEAEQPGIARSGHGQSLKKRVGSLRTTPSVPVGFTACGTIGSSPSIRCLSKGVKPKRFISATARVHASEATRCSARGRQIAAPSW